MSSKPEHKPGRNDPCWCGSGKKYKNCHMREDDVAASRVLTRNNLTKRLTTYALQREFQSDFENAYEFLLGRKFQPPHDEESMIESSRALDYFIHDYRLPDDKRVIERFAAEHGKRLSAEERALIEGWQHSRLTAFEVIAVEQGVGMRLRDLVSGEEFDVREKRGTQDLNRWEIVVSRLMRTGDHYEMGGATGMRLPMRYRDWVRGHLAEQWRHYQFNHPESTYEDFLHASSQLLMQFIEDEVMPALTAPPTVVTAEGDVSEFCKATFDVLDYTVALAGLRGAAELVEDETEDDQVSFGWSEEGVSLELLRAYGPAFEHKPAMGVGRGGFRNLGHLLLTRETLTLEVTSQRRLEAGKDLLAQRLGNAIQHRADEIKSITKALAQMPEKSEEEIAEEEPPEEIEAMQAEMEAQYHREWLDQKIPALGNETPRQAVKTFGGRVRVIRLLKELEASESARVRHGKIAYDFSELKQELGITDQDLLDESRLEDQMKDALDEIYELTDDDRVDDARAAWRAFRARYPVASEDDLEFAQTWDLINILDETLPHLGYRLATFQRYDDGIALLKEYRALDPDNPDAVRAHIAEMRAERGETERAVRELNELLENEPDSYAAITTLAAVQRDLLNRPDDAIATLRRGLDNVDEDDQGFLYEEIIETFLDFNRVDAAERFWREMNDEDAEAGKDYLGLAKIQMQRNDLEGARASARKIEGEPARNHWLGMVEARAHNFDAARQLWADDLEEPGIDRWGFWHMWVESHLRLREFDRVIEKVDLKKLRANASGYFDLAIAHAAKGNLERAAELAREGRAEMERRTRRIHWATIERETRALADELELSPSVRQAIGI
ncbi:MAG: SEC-C metal-binding domain-containing protein [Chloroflexota bacterium]